MADFTPNYNLKKPLRTEYYNVADANGNSDIVDTQLKAVNDRVDLVEGEVDSLELGKADKTYVDAQLAETEQEIMSFKEDYAKDFIMEVANLNNYPDCYIPNYMVNASGGIAYVADWGMTKIPIEDTKEYLSIFLPFNNYTGTIGRIAFYNDSTLVNYYIGSDYINGQYDNKNFITLPIPNGANNVNITSVRPDYYDNKETLIVAYGKYIPLDVNVEYIKSIKGAKIEPEPKKYSGIKWTVIGDSLTEVNIRALKRYHDYISEELGFNVYNMGLSGSGYKAKDSTTQAFHQRVLNLPTDTRIVTIFGSGNDLGSGTLGTPTDTDTTTICGSINKTIDNLYTVLPTVPFGIITPTPWVNTPPTIPGNDMELYVDALITICKRRGVPFLDLYHSSGLRPWDAAYRTLMYSRDDGNGVHPDENGHKLFAPQIREFVKSLI